MGGCAVGLLEKVITEQQPAAAEGRRVLWGQLREGWSQRREHSGLKMEMCLVCEETPRRLVWLKWGEPDGG